MALWENVFSNICCWEKNKNGIVPTKKLLQTNLKQQIVKVY